MSRQPVACLPSPVTVRRGRCPLRQRLPYPGCYDRPMNSEPAPAGEPPVTYLKQVQAPVGVKPVLKCWMKLN